MEHFRLTEDERRQLAFRYANENTSQEGMSLIQWFIDFMEKYDMMMNITKEYDNAIG